MQLTMFLPALLSLGQPANDELARTESAALEMRRSIRTIFVSLRVHTDEFGKEPYHRHGEMKIWADGRRMRVDHVDNFPGLGEMSGKRRVECFHCLRPGTRFTYNDTEQLQSTTDSIPETGFDTTGIAFDPRLFGYHSVPVSILRHTRLDGTIGLTKRKNASCRTEQLGGVGYSVIRYELTGQTDGKVAIWCDPKRGYHPVKFLLEASYGSTASDIDLQEVKSGFWYPKRVVYTVTREGKLVEKETVEVDEVRINQPIPDDVFSLKGIGMRDNTHIYSRADKERDWMWRDGKLVKFLDVKKQLGELPEAPVPVPLTSPTKPAYWLYALAALFVAAAGIFLRYAIRGAKRT